jgi:uncharacterized protein (TIGR01777 family)
LKALVTGATGLIGRRLIEQLNAPVVLSRQPGAARDTLGAEVSAWAWRPEAEPAPVDAFAGVDVIFHLAGESVADGRWTKEKKQRIHDSRVLGTRNLVAALRRIERRPRVLVAAAAIGYYGDRGESALTEDSPAGEGFLADVCKAWEAEADAAASLGLRVVKARIGLVLAPEGGALARMAPPFRLGVGGKLGDGRQWMSWIHADDVVGLLLLAAERDDIQGPLNLVGPEPAQNEAFTHALGRVLGRPTVLSVPRAALRIAFGELGGVLLESQRVLPARAQRAGYVFRYAELEPALRACLGQ